MAQILRKGSKNLNTENWKVYHPNGKHMFTCGERKAEWYVNNKLAINHGDKSIQLIFEPKGYGFKEDEIFGLAGRNIVCVVTNKDDDLQRHHIVPYCYRNHFPEAYKSKNHHDVVLVTYEIHQIYERHATKLKDQLAIDYNVKNLNECNYEYTRVLSGYAKSKVKMLSSLHSVFRAYGKLSQEKIKEILADVAENTDLSIEFLHTLNYIQLYKLYTILKEEHVSAFNAFKAQKSIEFDHGYQVVQQLDTHEKIEQFVIRWRKHFIETMNPQYMPEGWSVDFRVKVEL